MHELMFQAGVHVTGMSERSELIPCNYYTLIALDNVFFLLLIALDILFFLCFNLHSTMSFAKTTILCNN